jgi:hypothetical protein
VDVRGTRRRLHLGLAGAGAAFGVSATSGISAGGDVHRLALGRFADLFGGSTALPADNVILALDVIHPDGTFDRWVVPGTEGAEVESSPALLEDDRTGAVHLVWNSPATANQVFSRLLLRSWSPGGWSDLLDLASGSGAEKTAPALMLTRDGYRTVVAGVETAVDRQVIHLVWSEASDSGPRAFYSPIVFLNGAYIGWNPVVSLDEFAPAEPVSAFPAPLAIRQAPSLRDGGGADRVIASFVQSHSQQLATVVVRLLPGELGDLAEQARGSIIELGATLYPGQISELARQARGSIIELAGLFHSSAAGSMADAVANTISAADPAQQDLPGLAMQARGSIIELGSEILGAGLVNGCGAGSTILELPVLVPGGGSDFSHFFQFWRAATWNLPDLSAIPSPAYLVSPDGARAILGWVDGNKLDWRETLADGSWSETKQLDLTLLPVEQAMAVLERHLSGR